mmetsp:Transcript_9510/g.22395  ORF Transcript_9510/g.22395 Transcript_9510/m.22395 type:complete len:219 (-) Transcript_9510:2875-3531(-)
MEKDGGPPPVEEGGQGDPELNQQSQQHQPQTDIQKRIKSPQQKQQRPPRSLRLDSFADSLDRPSSSSSSSSEEDEETATGAPIASSRKRKRKFKPLRIPVTRTLTCPDMVRVDRCHRLPEYGPQILFFSGGSALRELSGILKNYTHNSIHLITPFDSGGSSAEIRRAFQISAVGDLRNRLVSLSDESTLGKPEVINFFSFRLNKVDSEKARFEFENIL